MTQDLTFDDASHSYSMAGRQLVSVTQVIGAVIPRKFNAGDFFLDRGSALHKAISLYSQGQLDWSSVDERYKPKLAAFLKFEKEAGYVVKQSEMRLASERYRYAGCVDALMVNPGYANSATLIVDFKSSIEPTVALQLSAYKNLLEENGHKPPDLALALELGNDGLYYCQWFKKAELRIAWQRFQAALTIYNFMRENGYLSKKEVAA